MQSTIGIVEPRYVTAVGMRTLLEAMLPHTDMVLYGSFEQCRQDIERTDGGRPYFVHLFVADSLLLLHADYFRSLPFTVFALCHQSENRQTLFPAIDVTAGEQSVYEQLLHLHAQGHANTTDNPILSTREIEVLKCVAKGMINKEIADSLCISLNTVLTHRQHITKKLGIQSVPALTLYAVLNGYILPSDIYKMS